MSLIFLAWYRFWVPCQLRTSVCRYRFFFLPFLEVEVFNFFILNQCERFCSFIYYSSVLPPLKLSVCHHELSWYSWIVHGGKDQGLSPLPVQNVLETGQHFYMPKSFSIKHARLPVLDTTSSILLLIVLVVVSGACSQVPCCNIWFDVHLCFISSLIISIEVILSVLVYMEILEYIPVNTEEVQSFLNKFFVSYGNHFRSSARGTGDLPANAYFHQHILFQKWRAFRNRICSAVRLIYFSAHTFP